MTSTANCAWKGKRILQSPEYQGEMCFISIVFFRLKVYVELHLNIKNGKKIAETLLKTQGFFFFPVSTFSVLQNLLMCDI